MNTYVKLPTEFKGEIKESIFREEVVDILTDPMMGMWIKSFKPWLLLFHFSFSYTSCTLVFELCQVSSNISFQVPSKLTWDRPVHSASRSGLSACDWNDLLRWRLILCWTRFQSRRKSQNWGERDETEPRGTLKNVWIMETGWNWPPSSYSLCWSYWLHYSTLYSIANSRLNGLSRSSKTLIWHMNEGENKS